MIYAIIAAAVGVLLMWGTIRVQHANNVSLKAQNEQVIAANKTTADSLKTCKAANKAFEDAAKVRKPVRAAVKPAKPDPKTVALERQLLESASTKEKQCEDAARILRDLATTDSVRDGTR